MSEEISVSLETAQAERQLAEVIAATESVQAEGDELERGAVLSERAESRRSAADRQPKKKQEADPSSLGLASALIPLAPTIGILVARGVLDAVDSVLEKVGAKNLPEAVRNVREIARRMAAAWGFADRGEQGG